MFITKSYVYIMIISSYTLFLQEINSFLLFSLALFSLFQFLIYHQTLLFLISHQTNLLITSKHIRWSLRYVFLLLLFKSVLWEPSHFLHCGLVALKACLLGWHLGIPFTNLSWVFPFSVCSVDCLISGSQILLFLDLLPHFGEFLRKV